MSLCSENVLLVTTSHKEDKRRILTTKVRGFADLPLGFSHGEGIPVSGLAILVAEQFIFLASLLELDADVFPNLDGGCAVAFYNGEESVEVSVGPKGERLDLRMEHGIGFQFEDVQPPAENVSPEFAAEQIYQLSQLGNWPWKLYASSTSAISTEQENDSETLFTGIPQGVGRLILQMVRGGSQSSMSLVPA
jgi:hypothetical protein